jgi:recombination protein RecA
VPKSDELVREINKKFKKANGEETIGYASDDRYAITRIPTGILTLDRLLGGGIAKGRYTELFGPYSALKTYTSLRTIASAQRKGLACLYADAERSFDPEWASRCGVDTSALRLYVPDFGEELIDVVEAILRSREYGLVVVDSIAALIPKAEQGESASKEQMGLMGRLTSKMMRRLTAALSTETAVILINQLREKIGIMFGKPETTTGGRSIPFYAGQRVEFRPGERIKETVDGKPVNIGRVVSITVEKDKTGPNVGRVGEVTFNYNEGIDYLEELVTLGEALGIVDRSGNTYSYRAISTTGRNRFKSALDDKPKARKRLRAAILQNGSSDVVEQEGDT